MRRALVILLLLPLATALPLSTAWEIENDTTFEDVPLVLAQDVVILPGATLRLDTVEAVVARPINITVRGKLELVDGTRLAAAAFPYDIYIAPGGRLVADDATIVAARVVVAGEALFDDALHAGGALDVRPAGVAEIHGTDFDASTGPAALIRAGGRMRLANSTIGRTGDYGVRIEGGQAVIENTTFALSPEYALYGTGANVTLVDNVFSTHCGAFLVSGSFGLIARNTFSTLDHGITLVSTGALDVRENVFDGTQTALLSYGGAIQASRNVFANNTLAVQTLFGSPSAPLLRNNTFVANGAAVTNEAAPSLDARWNWWGSATGPAAGDISGTITTSPWLAVAP